MPVSLGRQNSLDSDEDESAIVDAENSDLMAYPQIPNGKRPPPTRVSFSRNVRPSRSKLRDATPLTTPHIGPALAAGGVPLGERVYSIPRSTVRTSAKVPTGLSQPEATPLPLVPMIVLGIAMMGEFLSANVCAPWVQFMVKSFGVETSDVGLWTGILISVFFIAQFLTSLLWAGIAQHFGRRAVLFTSLVGSGLTCIAFGTSKSLEFALFARLLQGVFGGAVGVARGSVTSISDSTNEAQAYAILGFCWGFGGVGGAIIGGVFENPSKKWDVYAHIPVFVEFPYLLPTIVAALITVTGGILSLTLDYDGGSPAGTLSSTTAEPVDWSVRAEAGFAIPTQSALSSSTLLRSDGHSTRGIAENTSLQRTSGTENYGAIEAPLNIEQNDVRPGVPLGERTWTQSSAASGGSEYGDMHRSRFGVGVRHRIGTDSWASTAARRHIGADGELCDMYMDYEPEERESRLPERILMANEFNVTSLGDLWVASALTMDAEDEETNEAEDRFTSSAISGGPMESQRGSAISENTIRGASSEPRARSVSASRRTVLSSNPAPFRNNRPYSLVPSVSDSATRLVYPTIFQNTGLRSPSPAFEFFSDALDRGTIPDNASNIDVLPPIFEGKPVRFEAQTETGKESVFSQLPLVIIFQYGLLAFHSTTHDQLFMSYLLSERDDGGLQLVAGDFAQLIAMMCLAQVVFQFYVYPTMGPPVGRFSHISMFRIGGILMMFSYISVILIRPFARSGVGSGMVMTALGFCTAFRYCGITFSYTAVTVLLNYMSPPDALGLANGLAQSVVSLARFLGPILGGYLWSFSTHADPEGFAFGFWFCSAFCILALLHSFTLH